MRLSFAINLIFLFVMTKENYYDIFLCTKDSEMKNESRRN